MPRHLAIGLILLTLVSPGDAAEAKRPNIVVFLVDDMGLMDTSVPFLTDAKGNAQTHPLNRWYRTPSMARLARLGSRASQFYAMSVCSPSRVSLLTGQTSARHHTTQWINPGANNAGKFGPADWQWKGITPKHITLPTLLKEAGYRTIHCGKGHFGPTGSFGSRPEKFGFDVNIAGGPFGQPGSYLGKDNFVRGKKKGKKSFLPGMSSYHGKNIFLTQALTREANKAISASVKAGKPFFAYIAHYAVHSPFQMDARFADNYRTPPSGVTAKGGPPRAFATLIEGMDKSLGDILTHLEKLGVAEDTLVLFLGDNGSDAPLGPTHAVASSAPLRGKKGTHYEGGMRVPFIAAWARPNTANAFQKARPIRQGAIVNEMGVIYDLFPTLLAAAGVDVKKRLGDRHVIDGVDLAPMLAGKSRPGATREFLMHFPHQHRSSYFTSYRRGDWKVVYHYHKSGDERYELFDLASDRAEAANLAARQPAKLREMMKAMSDALARAGAQYPSNKDGKSSRPILP